jgi:hypothetical protein
MTIKMMSTRGQELWVRELDHGPHPLFVSVLTLAEGEREGLDTYILPYQDYLVTYIGTRAAREYIVVDKEHGERIVANIYMQLPDSPIRPAYDEPPPLKVHIQYANADNK